VGPSLLALDAELGQLKKLRSDYEAGVSPQKQRNLELILFPLTAHVKGNRTVLLCKRSSKTGRHDWPEFDRP
jgi:hypothetical protein